MRYVVVALAFLTTLACSSSQGLQQDVGEATLTESKSGVRGCTYLAPVSVWVDLPEFGGDRDAAMELLFDRLRNAALHKRCDTVYLVSVQETPTRITAKGEGYACKLHGITDGASGGNRP